MPKTKAADLAAQRASQIGIKFVGPYLGVMTKTAYLCEIHGAFMQTPNKVQQSLGCQKCGRISQGAGRKLDVGRLQSDAAKVGITFKGNFKTTQVCATYECAIHGSFELRPASVVAGRGCPECGRIAGGLKRRKPKPPQAPRRPSKVPLEQLFSQANAVGLRYADDYVPSTKRAKYVCETHGDVWMFPTVVRRGGGCRFCAGNTQKSESVLAEEASKVGLRYVGPYKSDSVSTFYECARHGLIKKLPGSVKSGSGCRHCARYGFDPSAPATFYMYRVERVVEPSFIGYGLTKDHRTRHAAHMATFRAAGAVGELLATFDLPSGRLAADLEIHLRRCLSAAHIRTSLRGFKEEAVAVEFEPEILTIVTEWISAARTEVRVAA